MRYMFDNPNEVRALFAVFDNSALRLAEHMGFKRQRVQHWLTNEKIPPLIVMAYRRKFRAIMEKAGRARDQGGSE